MNFIIRLLVFSFDSCHCERKLRSNPLVENEIASTEEHRLAMTYFKRKRAKRIDNV